MSTAAVATMFRTYQSELKDHYEVLKTRAEGLQGEAKEWVQWAKNEGEARKNQIQPIIMEQKGEIETMVKDQSPLQCPNEHAFMRDNYGWLSICFTGFMVGETVGHMLTPLFAMAFTASTAGLLAYVLLPTYFWLLHRKTEMSECNRRGTNLMFSTILGACVAFLFHDLQFSFFTPPAFVLPLAISVMNGITQTPARSSWLGGALGAGVGAYMLYGFAMGISTLYLLFVVAFCAVAFVDMQVKVGRLRAGQVQAAALEQLVTIFGHAVFVSLMYIMFASSREQVENTPPPPQQ